MPMENKKERLMEQLFETYYTRLYLYALNFLEDEEDAKDVVSDAFATIWQQWQHETEPKEPSSSYLYTTVRNQCIDLLRHSKVKENYATFVEQYGELSDEDGDEYEERIQELARHIEELPEPEKSILHCCYFKHMSYQETADALQLTLVVVKKRMLKVFKLLREVLRNDED